MFGRLQYYFCNTITLYTLIYIYSFTYLFIDLIIYVICLYNFSWGEGECILAVHHTPQTKGPTKQSDGHRIILYRVDEFNSVLSSGMGSCEDSMRHWSINQLSNQHINIVILLSIYHLINIFSEPLRRPNQYGKSCYLTELHNLTNETIQVFLSFID